MNAPEGWEWVVVRKYQRSLLSTDPALRYRRYVHVYFSSGRYTADWFQDNRLRTFFFPAMPWEDAQQFVVAYIRIRGWL